MNFNFTSTIVFLMLLQFWKGASEKRTAIQCYSCTLCSTPSITPTNCSSTQDACQSITTDAAGSMTYTQSCTFLGTNTASCTTSLPGVTTCYCLTDLRSRSGEG